MHAAVDVERREFLSIWEIAFRWEGIEPSTRGTANVPENVLMRLRQLIWSASHGLSCYDANGASISMQTGLSGVQKTDARRQLDKAYRNPIHHQGFLRKIFIRRTELNELLPYMGSAPSFWFGTSRDKESGSSA